MTTNQHDVLKVLLVFAINTYAMYVPITLFIIFHVPHGGLHKRIIVIH